MYQEDQIEKIIFGNAIFKKLQKKNKKNIEQSNKIQSILKSKKWIIKQGDYQKYKWQKIFPYMNECLAQTINIGENNRAQILAQIQYVNFTNLKQLYLHKNQINNVQSLSYIFFQHLQRLDISSNEISQVKCLSKISAPSLKCLVLMLNPLVDINSLTKAKITPRDLRHLDLQYSNFHNLINQDVSIFVKLNSVSGKSTGIIEIRSDQRIKQIKVLSMMKQRGFFLQLGN